MTHFLNLTFWDDFDAIKRFAGEDYSRARYYDFDPGIYAVCSATASSGAGSSALS